MNMRIRDSFVFSYVEKMLKCGECHLENHNHVPSILILQSEVMYIYLKWHHFITNPEI